MQTIQLAAIPQVDVDFMNDDHEEAITLINKLLVAIAGKETASISPLLQAFYQHNQTHFAAEEAEMQRVNFPPYSCHKAEHERVLQEMRHEQAAWGKNQNLEELKHYLTEIVSPWFFNHVNTMDTVTAMFIKRAER